MTFDPSDPRISQEQLHYGVAELRASNLLRPEVYDDYVGMNILVGRIFSAMRRREKEVVPQRDVFIIGGGKRA